ncbi:MAG: tetratricopeptide repeat protein [Cyanobacteria bacterium P01_D01_bin.115]
MRHPARLLSLAIVTALRIIALPATLYPLPTTAAVAQSTVEDRQAEADRLFQQGIEQARISQFHAAIQIWQEAFEVYAEIGDRKGAGGTLNNLGNAYLSLSQYPQAISLYEQALNIARELGDRELEGSALGNLGVSYDLIGNYPQAIDFYKKQLEVVRSIGDRQGASNALGNLGIAYFNIGDYPEAIVLFEQSLEISRELDDRVGESSWLLQIGNARNAQGDYEQAIELYTQSLTISQEIGDRGLEGTVLGNLGTTYSLTGAYAQAIEFFEQHLAITREIGDRAGEGGAINRLGAVSLSTGDYAQAIESFEQHLAIAREIGDRAGEGSALGNLGNVYFSLGEYAQAIDFLEQRLVIARNIGDRAGEGRSLGTLGAIYFSLGEYAQAINFYEQRLAISREIGDRAGEGSALGNLGSVYANLDEYLRAIDFHEQRLVIARNIGDRAGEGPSLGSLGNVYFSLGEYAQAINFYEQSLAIARDIGDRAAEGRSLGNLGGAYFELGEYAQAINFYEQSLAISRDIGNRAGEGIALGNLGKLLADQDQPELAIVFLKSSVAVHESIRITLRTLDTELQQSFTDTVAGTYRFLADLLLEAGRIPEAQQVLDLLKLEELREFTNTTRATWTGNALQYTDPEQAVIDAHGSLIALGNDLIACEDTNCADLETLDQRLEALKAQYDAQVAEFEATIRANRADDEIFQNPDNLSGDAEKLLTAYAAEGQNALLIYPFVLEDKLWLVWAAAGNVIGSVEVPVSQRELATTVQRFGAALNAPGNSDELQAISQQLYDWIMQPLETELTDNKIGHLIFVNDRVTRYIPMAALFDGEHYLLERYQISTVLAPGLTDTTDRLTDIDQSQVLGLGLTQAVAGFNPLPAVDDELNEIVRSDDTDTAGIYPGQVLLDDDFTLESLKANVRDHRVLHMATHAAFVPGRAEESFVVLGNGEKLTIADIEAMERRLSNLHLVVLSACQTALGGAAGDGTEIAGISSYFLEQGRAETVIASLWAVNDNSTSILMQRFYELLATGELTKAEALRQAQLSLLYDEDTKTRLAATRTGAPPVLRDGFDAAVAEPGYRHPYYWAPFILIGNGL